jgi:two-component system, NarL family, sensor kinase
VKPKRDPGSAGRLAAAEEWRRRIAREIHDDFSQRLAGLACALKALRKQLPEGDPQLSELDAIGGGLAELAEDLRRLSHDLHPAALERHGLAEALRDHCEEIERCHGLPVRLHLRDAVDSLPPDVALGLYRIIQEALANTVRHAAARTVHVTLSAAGGEVRLTVADDGRGFDPGAARRSGGIGLASMEERAQLLGGRCRVVSVPGAGTEIEATVPVPTQGALAPLRERARRHRGLVASVALVILVLVAGLVATLLRARRLGRKQEPAPLGNFPPGP